MRQGSRHIRTIQQQLDQYGVTTNIVRVAPSQFQLIVNFEIIKQFRKRASANHRVHKLYTQHCILNAKK